MKEKNDTAELGMVYGPLGRNLFFYSLPLVFSGLLQLLFNAADTAVVGRFTGSAALAAVSAASPVASLFVTLFMGLSTGTNVLLAQALGAGNMKKFGQGEHTSVAAAFLIGILLMLAGLLFSKPLMVLISTPADILPLSLIYLRIYLLGVPAMMIYNFGSAILRACGDTKRPLAYMAAAGSLNVVLNLIFVIVFNGGTAGVAAATAISETFSAILILIALTKTDNIYKLNRGDLHIDGNILKQLFGIGIPSAIQGTSFSIANLLIQSAINSFGPSVMAASAAAMNIDSFCYVAVDAMGQGILTFTSQNYGAGNYARIQRLYIIGMTVGVCLQLILGISCYIFSSEVMSVFTKDPVVISYGKQIMRPICVFGFVNTTMNIPFHVVRGMGHSVFPMICTIFCVCVLRIVWVYTVFPHIPTVAGLYAAWPVTKAIASLCGIIFYHAVMRRLCKVQ